MKQVSTFFLRGVLCLVALPVLALCTIGLPYVLITGDVGYYFPILLGLYVPAVLFFLALYQTFKLLRYIDTNQAFSELSVTALRNIKYYAVYVSAFFTLGMPYFFYAAHRDDAPGVVAAGFLFLFVSVVIAVFAAVLQKLLQNGMEIKSENDLTV